jgi:putative FmdB family regulatory protein
MPIYAYRCGACGHAKDVLQKISDPLLTTCPACGAEAFSKQLTAAGFQLKGSGWYVTDFRGGNTAPAKADEAGAVTPAAGGVVAAPAPGAPAAANASGAPSPAPAPAAASPTGSSGSSGPSGSGSAAPAPAPKAAAPAKPAS